jgi:ankyrin repeat protein
MSTGDSVFLCALSGNETAVSLWLNENENRSNASITQILFGLAKYGHSQACLRVFQQLIQAVDITAMRGSSSEGLHVVSLESILINACRHGNIRIVDFLVSNYSDCDIRKALNVASMRGQEKLVDRLLSAYEVNDSNA